MQAEYLGKLVTVLEKTCGLTRVQDGDGYEFWAITDKMSFLIPENEKVVRKPICDLKNNG